MRIIFLVLLFCAFPSFGQTDRMLVMNDGRKIPFLKLEMTDKAYVVNTLDGKIIEVPFEDAMIKIVSDTPVSPVPLRVETEKPEEPKPPQKPPVVKWNLPYPAPKILPIKAPPT